MGLHGTAPASMDAGDRWAHLQGCAEVGGGAARLRRDAGRHRHMGAQQVAGAGHVLQLPGLHACSDLKGFANMRTEHAALPAYCYAVLRPKAGGHIVQHSGSRLSGQHAATLQQA